MSSDSLLQRISQGDGLSPFLRASLTLAAAALATAILLRLSGTTSRRLRAAAWMFVLLQGCLVWTWPVSVTVAKSLAGPDDGEVVRSVIGPSAPAGTSAATAGRNGVGTSTSFPTTAAAPALVRSTLPAPSPPSSVSQSFWSWRRAVAAVWLTGLGIALVRAWQLRRRFLRLLNTTEPAPAEWSRELEGVADGLRLARSPALLLHAAAGPCLTWRRGGYVVVVPRDIWSTLPAEERRLILRHELAHLRRGDLWTGLAARGVAAIHWFNPFAWLAVRRLEECAEWACDEAACGDDGETAARYSRLLISLRLGQSSFAYGAAMADGRTVAERVRRLLRAESAESTARGVVLALAVLAAFIGLRLEIRLRAEEADGDETSREESGVLAVFPADAPGVPGKPRPEGLLAIIGDERTRLSAHPTRLVLTTDGSRIFGVTGSDVIDVFDARSRRLTECIPSPGGRVLEVTPSPDGRRLAVASLNGTLRIYDISVTPARLQEELLPFGADPGDVWLNLTASTDRARFCLSNQKLVSVLEWTDSGLKTVFEKRDGNFSYRPAVLSPNGERLAIRSQGQAENEATREPEELSLWDLSKLPGDEVDRITLEDRFISAIGFRDDEMLVLSRFSEEQPTVQLVLCSEGRLQLRGEPMTTFSVSPLDPPIYFDDGRRCLTWSKGPSIVDCSGEVWKVEQTLAAPPGHLRAAAISPDGQTLYAVSGRIIRGWERRGDAWRESFGSEEASQASDVQELTFLADGRTLIFNAGNSLRAYSTIDSKHPAPIGDPLRLRPSDGIGSLTRHPSESKFLAVGGGSNGCAVSVELSPAGLKELARVDYGQDWKNAPWCAGYSPDGSTVAVGFWDRSIRLYDASLGLLSDNANQTVGHVCVLTFSPDGRRLACGDFTRNLKLFDVERAKITESIGLPQHGEAVRFAEFTPDGKTLISGSQNGEVRINDLSRQPPPGRLLLFPDQREGELTEIHGGVTALELVADGRLLLTSTAWLGSRRVALWSIPAGELLQVWEFPGWGRAAISPDGMLVAVARADGTICLLEVSAGVRRYVEGK